jgi:16S rRNA U516 pseudouridylate synthase RsuA-like enzyme
MNTQKNYYEEEAERVRRFKCEVKDAIDEMTWKTMDEVQERLKTIMPQVREAAENAAAALKALIEGAAFDDEHLKKALYESLDKFPNIMEMYIAAGIRSAVRKSFEAVRLDVDEKVNMALEGLDLLAGE